MKLKISIIAAIGKNRELGKDNKLLWHIPEDLKRFKELTNGHPIIMGRKTFESIGRVLPNRLNIVITRDPDSARRGLAEIKKGELVKLVTSLEEAIEVANKSVILSVSEGSIHVKDSSAPTAGRQGVPQNDNDENEVFIIGGGQIFQQALPLADRLYLTIVDKEYDADTFFPEYPEFTKEIEKVGGELNGLKYTYLTLDKC